MAAVLEIGPWEPLLRIEPRPTGGRRLVLNRSVPDTEKQFEIVSGAFVAKRMTGRDAALANDLCRAFSAYGCHEKFGWVGIGMLYDMPRVDNFRRADVSLVTHEAWPARRRMESGEAWSVTPALVVEMLHPEQSAEDVLTRVEDFFAGGVGMVWVVAARIEKVYCYTSPTAVRILTRADDLTADPLIPGFRLPLADLFPPADPTPDTP